MNYLDTGIGTSEIKAMIKTVSITTVAGGINKVNQGLAAASTTTYL